MQMHASRREFLTAAALTALARRSAAAQAKALTPESFGARGDGSTNDTEAFVALSKAVNASGGGTIVLRHTTYIVGQQGERGRSLAQGWPGATRFSPSPILSFINCTGPVVIRGNGARIRAADELRYGMFDPATGQVVEAGVNRPDLRQYPYVAMVDVLNCSGLLDISDLELDGNLGRLQIGGKSGKAGWQIPGAGIRLLRNSGPQRLTNIHSHHHPLDGLTVWDRNDRTAATSITNLICEENARQGCTITSGRNYSFERCRFTRTGRGGLASPPCAGVDIEAEGTGVIRNVAFKNCEFSDNVGCGLVADSGDSADLRFADCRFIGTTNWSAWPSKPDMRFAGCTFVGAVAHAFGDTDPARAVQFIDCDFLDDPASSPSRRVYLGGSALHPIVNVPTGPNVRFDHCRFRLNHSGGLPYTGDAIYSDCEMAQALPVRSHPRGTYLGTNSLTGPIDLSGAKVRGEVVLNGRVVPRS